MSLFIYFSSFSLLIASLSSFQAACEEIAKWVDEVKQKIRTKLQNANAVRTKQSNNYSYHYNNINNSNTNNNNNYYYYDNYYYYCYYYAM